MEKRRQPKGLPQAPRPPRLEELNSSGKYNVKVPDEKGKLPVSPKTKMMLMGKYKDQHIRCVPTAYVKWMLKNLTLSPTGKSVLKKELRIRFGK